MTAQSTPLSSIATILQTKASRKSVSFNLTDSLTDKEEKDYTPSNSTDDPEYVPEKEESTSTDTSNSVDNDNKVSLYSFKTINKIYQEFLRLIKFF